MAFSESSFDFPQNIDVVDSSSLLPVRPYIRLESSTGTDDSLRVPPLPLRDCGFELSSVALSASTEQKGQQNITEMIELVKLEVDELLKTPRLATYQKRNPTSFDDNTYSHPSAKPAPLRLNSALLCLSAKPEPLTIVKRSVMQASIDPAMPDVTRASWHKSAQPQPLCFAKTKGVLKPVSENVRSSGLQNKSSDKENQQPSPPESVEEGRNGVTLSEWSLYEEHKGSISGQSFIVQSPAQNACGFSGKLFSASRLDFEIYVDPEETQQSDPIASVVGQVTPIQELTETEGDDSIDFLLDPLPNAPALPLRNPLFDHSSMICHKDSLSGGYPLEFSPESRCDSRVSPVAEKHNRSRNSAALDALVYEIAQPMHENVYDDDGFLKESFIVPTFHDDACDEHEEAADLDEQLRRRLHGQQRPSRILLWGLGPQIDEPVDSVDDVDDIPRLSVDLSHTVSWSYFEKKPSSILAAPLAG